MSENKIESPICQKLRSYKWLKDVDIVDALEREGDYYLIWRDYKSRLRMDIESFTKADMTQVGETLETLKPAWYILISAKTCKVVRASDKLEIEK